VFPQVSLANLQARKLDAQIWTAGALAGMVRPAHSLHVETPYAGGGAGGPGSGL